MLKNSGVGQLFSKWSGLLMVNFPFSANQITVSSVLFAIAGFVASIFGQLWIALILFLLAALCDMADGAVARLRHEASAKGAYLDGVTDRIVEFFHIAALMLQPGWPLLFFLPASVWLAALLFFGACLTAFIPAYAFYRGIRVQKEFEGVLPRPERIALYLLMIALLALNQTSWASFMLVLSVLLAFATSMQRLFFYWFYKAKK